MEASDRELMARLAAGDREALGPLMERHHGRIYRIALSYLRDRDEAQDAVQETFVKACQGAARWDGSAEVAPWLSRIAVNHAIDRYRRGRRRLRSETPIDDQEHGHQSIPAEAPSPERRAMDREAGQRISAALSGLPARQRAVVVLRLYEEMNLEEIARTLDMNLGTVKSSLHRALRRMRLTLAGLRP
jgi:RNA polymerase sigma-70 factor (ECF subfamily)